MLFWFLIGFFLLISEIVFSTFFIMFFGVAALSVGVLLFFFSVAIDKQVIIFALLAVAYLGIFRKVWKKKKHQDNLLIVNDLVGQYALVFEDIFPNNPGKVLIGDTVWKAHAMTALSKGDRVRIIAQNNITLEVESCSSPQS